ncbi:MAG: M24 family metallopeptidase [Planctomycetota bacterium]|nr:M24 family metallopeptidase [Planctomycetota bacterium]
MNHSQAESAILMAGIPTTNLSLYHRIRFLVGDPAALIELPTAEGTRPSTLILRDIEMQRAGKNARVDQVACPADYAPESGLSGDRETATAQAAAEFIHRTGRRHVITDRSLPLIYAHHLQERGLSVECDLERGVQERRAKDDQEIAWLQEAQQATEGAMQMACELVANSQADKNGELLLDGAPLTSERIRSAVDLWLLERGYSNPASIVAGGPAAADCHNLGTGILLTEQPVIIDIFPRNRQTLYHGDCTRTVVHGTIHDEIASMHAAVVAAKAAGTAATQEGSNAQAVHQATIDAIRQHGYQVGLPGEADNDDYCAMTHGTGHGIGLEVHEPPLLDFGGPDLIRGDALTIEPGLYRRSLGGVRVEDMVIVTADGCLNLNQLPEGLDWSC